MTGAAALQESGDHDAFGTALTRLITSVDPTVQLTGFKRLSGGASQESWMIRAVRGEQAVDFVLRRGQGGSDETRAVAIGLPAEAAVIRAAAQHGVPVPEVVHVLELGEGLGTGFLMRRVHGETIARKILRDAAFADVRPRLAGLCGEVLAGIAALPLSECPPLRVFGARARLETMHEHYLEMGQRRPVFEYAYRWLQERVPADPERMTLVHGDFRNGNLMIDSRGVAAVLDWELAHIGDPLEDLGWLCVPSWRFGEIDKPAGGFGSVDDLVAGYERAGGTPVDRRRLQFWMVLGTLYWGQSCVSFACEFRAGDRTVERASIGRRASETEIDLLMLTRARDGELL